MENITPTQLRQRIYDARLSVNQVMKEAGTSSNTLWRWESGKCSPHPATLGRILDALGRLTERRG